VLKANRELWMRMVALSFLIATPAPGQVLEYDVTFPDGAILNVPCPPSFPAVYPHMSFWGLSQYSMRQYDQEHGTVLHTYAFNGLSIDEDWRIKGIHHVAPSQCASAAWGWLTGSPAVIAYLHNAQLTFLGGTGGDGCGSYRYVSSDEPCDDSEVGTGGGDGGEDGDGDGGAGGGEPDLCETLRLLTGSCYDVYVDGTYQGEICC
jgi:hypothetical protein